MVESINDSVRVASSDLPESPSELAVSVVPADTPGQENPSELAALAVPTSLETVKSIE